VLAPLRALPADPAGNARAATSAAATSATAADRPIVVLLGASNLTLGLDCVIETARQIHGGPADFLVACGHGRSYGHRTVVFGRELPGIAECRLWPALRRYRRRRFEVFGEAPPVHALVTDIGNDIMYGTPPETIIEWVRTCLARLRALGGRVVLTSLPMPSIRRLTPTHYEWMRRIFFPDRRRTFDQAVADAHHVQALLESIAREDDEIALVEHDARWYGVDPIHIRSSWRSRAWRRILLGRRRWRERVRGRLRRPRLAEPDPARALYLAMLPPRRRTLLGWRHVARQPAGRLADGSTIAVY